jgi:alpha-glucosidase (family GH31 glycosyl hydrolase)
LHTIVGRPIPISTSSARPLFRRTTSTTTAWARTRKGSSTTAATRFAAGRTTQLPLLQASCVPFLITNKGYGLVWDNPSKTTIEPGFNEQTRWISEVGDRVSFFVIAGGRPMRFIRAIGCLTGPTPMLPKAAYGYIQCKQRYASQDEVLSVAKGYRDRHLPADVLVVDWFYYTKMGQMDLDPKFWPDPTAMNKQLHDMGFETMISVWPRFVPDDRFYSEILKNGWFIHTADGTADQRPSVRSRRVRHRHDQSRCRRGGTGRRFAKTS